MSDTINIYFAADDHYILPVAAAVRSLLDTADDPSRYHVHVLCRGELGTTIERLKGSWDLRGGVIEFIDTNCLDLSGLPPVKHITETAYARLFIPMIARQRGQGRAIYLDSDLIVLSDLAELWNTPLRGAPMAAVKAPTIPYVSSSYGVTHWQELDLDERARYFNSGVMVIDIQEWCRLALTEVALDYARRYFATSVLGDQEALNAAVNGNWAKLALGWNVLAYYRYGPNTAEYFQARREPRILHFVGPRKPWLPDPLKDPSGVPHADIFYKYLDKTEWSGARPRC